MANRDTPMSTSDVLIPNDIVIPVGLDIPAYATFIKGKVIRQSIGFPALYNVEFRDVITLVHRENLILYHPWLVPGDKVRLVPDDEDQVESILRMTTTEEMATEIGVVTKVANGWGCTSSLYKEEPSAKTRTPDTFWYYTVEWPSGKKDNFLHDGDLQRVDEEER